MTEDPDKPTARCSCGQLTVTVHGDPREVYACSCVNCQRESGSAFTYVAVFPEVSITIAGEQKLWRRDTDTGSWLESGFCPTCGSRVLLRIGQWPGVIAISVGCFADPGFVRPEKIYWASHGHAWMRFPGDVELLETQ